MKFVVTLASVFVLFAAAQANEQDLEEISLGVISSESQEAVVENWRPLTELMTSRLGISVRAYFSPDYAGVIQAMRFGKVQVAQMGAKAAVEAIDRSEGEVFAKPIPLEGEPGYHSVIIARKGGPVSDIQDMIDNGSRYVYGSGDPNSTSGFLVPGYYVFARNRIDPKTHFKSTVFANHMNNFLAVLNGHVDVAANNTFNLDTVRRSDPAKLERIRIIWKSPLIPDAPLLWRKDLSARDKSRIAAFFTSLGGPGPDRDEELAALAHNGWARIEPADDGYLLPVRELVLFKKKMSIEQDESLAAKDREARIAEIDAELARLQRGKN